MGPVARQGPREKLFAFGGFVTAWDVISAQGTAWKEKRKKAVDYNEFSTFSTDFSTAGYPQFHIPVEKESMLT